MTWHRPTGSLTDGPWAVSLSPETAEWSYSGLHVLELPAGVSHEIEFPDDELVLVPLRGSFQLDSTPLTETLHGRRDPFSELTDRAYLPPGTQVMITSEEGGQLAICTARADSGGPARVLPAGETSVEVRGAGQATRQINGLWTADVEGPERIIVVEVLTPAGNWSSYPPHKHDEWGEHEVPLEEIYYFRIKGEGGFGLHRTYTADNEVNETVAVKDGDVFLIPRGYHGPCVAAPGYDMYYLNVMAGPERAWSICNDPAHSWVADLFDTMTPDPRLPRR